MFRTCTIFFGFQRCALSFCTNAAYLMIPVDVDPGFTYIFITREKSRTYPIITTIPPLANSVRAVVDKSLKKVLIENKDAQLLDGVMDILRSFKNTQLDVLHYQMCFQYRRNKADKMIPRSIILSQEMLLLCDEDLTTPSVQLKLVDSIKLKGISRVKIEDNPHCMTIYFKSNVVTSRKWRLFFETRTAASRTRDECKRACSEVGNNILD